MRAQKRLLYICSPVCAVDMLQELSFITLLVLLCQRGVKAVGLITCEGETTRLTCAQGTVKVLAANYGRTDSTTCSTGRPAGQLSNVQCVLTTSLNVTAPQCDGKQNCSIVASNANFSDPCPGTYKYLNVSFDCIVPSAPQPPPPSSVTSKELLTCESDTARLSCDQGTIKVLAASYGRTSNTTCSAGRPASQLSNVQCVLNTSLSVMATQCDGKQNCSIVASNANFSDPCPGTYKYLNVSFDCIVPPAPQPPPPSNVPPKQLLTCESDTARLSCDQGYIKVLAANYGRTNSTTCSAGRPASQLSNVQCVQNTSLSVMANKCDGKEACSVAVGNTVFGDPCFGTYKYLNVSYACVPKTSVTCQNKSSSISCEGKRRLYIHYANYGRRDMSTCPCADVGAMSSTCISVQTKTLQFRCNGKKHCHVHASNSEFVDRCPHTHKYLEVFYFCV